ATTDIPHASRCHRHALCQVINNGSRMLHRQENSATSRNALLGSSIA
ncbi:MAG: hypothetical protein HZB51_06435, partial [Chloroflexi bacterium]|nr:hypothetical protein [Chloroflexota bacterium]